MLYLIKEWLESLEHRNIYGNTHKNITDTMKCL